MENTLCAVCKQPIDDALIVHSGRGPVHPGICLQIADDAPVVENGEDSLYEMELLL